MVIDGWRRVSGNLHWHMNFGWVGTSSDTWYAIDHVPFWDMIVRDITPAPSMGGVLTFTGYAVPPYPYRYFDQDCISIVPTMFLAGHKLQFFPRVKLTCFTPGSENYIRILGNQSFNTRLFSIDGTASAGIAITNGEIRLHKDGAIKFH